MLPRVHGRRLYKNATTKDLDNRVPRDFVKTVENDKALNSATRGRILRAEAAFANGFENFGPFCAALVAANAARLEPGTLNRLSLAYLATRMLYNHTYINNETQLVAGLRSSLYMGGLGMLFYMFVKAGSELSK